MHVQPYLYIPDFMASWPWPRRINPLYEEVAAESNAWLMSFAPFTPQSQHAFEQCDFGRLAALAYPDASRGAYRMGSSSLESDAYAIAPLLRHIENWRGPHERILHH